MSPKENSSNATEYFDSALAKDKEALQDRCGIVGILSSVQRPLFKEGLIALSELQTRGYNGAGFSAFRNDGSVLYHKRVGTVSEVFPPGIEARYSQQTFYNAQLQVRYGTSGEFTPENVQPYIARHIDSNERFMVSHNGQFSIEEGDILRYESDTTRFVWRLSQSEGETWTERIQNTLLKEKGAFSLIISTENSMYLARDPYGIRPLYFAQMDCGENGFLTMAASETVALSEAGFNGPCDLYEVLPGQLVRIDKNMPGFTVSRFSTKVSPHNCAFENIYTQGETGAVLVPRTIMTEVRKADSVRDVRERYGQELAFEAPVNRNDVDLIVGIPGTGITGGEAYAEALGLGDLYFQAIKDKNTPGLEQRTFMQADINDIYKMVINHFNFDASALIGKRVVLVDDSIVRGNISRGLVSLLKKHYNVLEVHVRVLCPPINQACFLGINTRTQYELIAAQHSSKGQKYSEMVESICNEIGADSLYYLSSEGLLKAMAGDPHDKGFCMGCMVGHKPPIDRYGRAVN